MALLRQQLKQEWRSLLVWCIVCGGLIFWVVTLFKSLSGSMEALESMVHQMPEAIRAIYGGGVSIRTLPGFLQAYGFGPWIWIPYLIYAALFAAAITTREIDRRTMEFLLSLPVDRWQVLLSRWAGMALALLILHGAHFLAVLGGVLAIGEQPEPGRYLLAAFNGFLLFLAVGSIALAVDQLIDDYGRAVGVNLGIGLGLFVCHVATEQEEGLLRTVRGLLPTAFYDPGPILTAGTVPWGDLAVLGTLALAGLSISILLFQRKQIAV